MEIIRWDDSLRVNVVQIDNEHRLICTMINDLQKVMEASEGVQVQVVQRLLTELLAAITRHFASEEQFLQQAGYPDRADHQQLHRGLEQKLEHFRATGAMVVNTALISFLRQWFLEHLQVEDQKYAQFMKSR